MNQATVAARLGRAIRLRRLDLGVSQDAFADSIDMHRAYYSAIERGEKNLTLHTLQRIARGLGTPMAALMQEAGV